MRVRLLPLLVVLSGCASTASVSGDAFAFNEGTDARVEGARVYVLEDPSHEVLTDATGHFVLEGLEVGTDATLVLDHPDFVAIQTATFEVPAEGLERVTFQAVRPNIYDALAALLSITPDPERCQMVTTVTRVGRSLYDPGAHGEAGATVTIDPPLPAESGPIYFNSMVFPDESLTETSDDGGVLFLNVPPGTYTWTAQKDGVAFRSVRITCRAGVLVNASPPWGLQALE
ncbi:MAG: carboxypeptidase regulatory-like domain-containing protein [Myxococcales bacterium]|nr:carboxypeptidase regulatory-like domain-containing protein [Myxococcales bacterium]